MTRSALLLAASLAVSVSGCIVAQDPGATLSIENRSSYVLTEVHVTGENDPNWGPNLVPDVLYPGEAVVAYGLPCGYYDVLVVDETGLDCPLYGLHLCFDDRVWFVTDSTLDVCAFPKINH